MSNNSERERKIQVLQQNLSSIRKIAGWTTEEMGDKIGVTKQTISNLENGKTNMNFTQYIAIRSVLDCEISENKDNETLAVVVEILLEHADELSEEDYKEVKDSISMVASTAIGGVAGAALTSVFKGISVPILVKAGLMINPGVSLIGAIVGAAAGVVGNVWLKNFLKK